MSHLRNMFGGGNKNAAYEAFEDDSSDPNTGNGGSSPEEPEGTPLAAPTTSDDGSSSEDSSDDSSSESLKKPPVESDSSSEDSSGGAGARGSSEDVEVGSPPPSPPSDEAGAAGEEEPVTIDAEVTAVQSPPSFKDYGDEEEKQEEDTENPSQRSRDPEADYPAGAAQDRGIDSGRESGGVSKDPIPASKKPSKSIDEAPEDACLSNRRVQVGFFASIVLVVVIVVAAVVSVSLDDDGAGPPTMEPTLSFDPSTMPSFAPNPIAPEDEALLELWESVVGEAIYEEGTAYNEAAQWMLFRDPSRMSPDSTGGEATRFLQEYSDSDLDSIQRFLLTYLWFATTNNGREQWISCNPSVSTDFEEEDCIYQKVIRRVPEGLQYTQIPWTRWLSGADECDWAGITCKTTPSGRSAVSGIDLGKFFNHAGRRFDRFLLKRAVK